MKTCLFYTLLGLFFATTLSAQGPITGFMPGKKSWDFALSYGAESYNDYLFGDEKRTLENQNQSVSLFVERGFSDSFSLVLSLPYVHIDDINQGLQDGNLFIKYRNKNKYYEKGNLSLISAVGASFPFSNYPNDTETPIGERAVLFQGRFLAQYNFNSGFFLHLQSGINFRIIPSAQSSLPVLFRAGFGSRKIYVDGWIEWFKTFNSGVDTAVFGGAGSDWTKIGLTLYYSITPSIGVVANGSYTTGGRNIGLASRWGAGVVYKLRKKEKN